MTSRSSSSVHVQVGRTEPRIWTKPLRELTRETSLGFEVIDFASQILGVTLYPWQKWLLIHALELLADGSYRFRRVVVLVARQNGKTLLASVLTAWWLFIDSDRHPDRVPPIKFKVVGTAQNLDIARGPWAGVKAWCDPDPDAGADDLDVIEALQAATMKVYDANGKESIILKSKAHYEVRAAAQARGKPAARVIMDELREQKNWEAWNAVSQTTKSFWSGQLWGFSNAGTPRAVVLQAQRKAGRESIAEWEQYVESGIMSAEAFANEHDISIGIFEWSAAEGLPKDDVEGILQANPSIGYGGITVATCLSDARSMPEGDYRTEVLCQWVSALVVPDVDQEAWTASADGPEFDETGALTYEGSRISSSSPLVVGVDVSADRQMTYVGVVGDTDDGRIHLEVVAMRAGMLWVVDYVTALCEQNGTPFVAMQARGCGAADFVEPLKKAGLAVIEIQGTALGSSCGRTLDRIRDRKVAHRGQPILDMAASGAVTKKLGEVRVWDRDASAVDAAPLVAVSNALYGLENLPEVEEQLPSPYEERGLMVV